MTPTAEDVERLTKQNAMLMRTLLRVKAERDALAQQLAAQQPRSEVGGVA
jgi:hypothetical protein